MPRDSRHYPRIRVPSKYSVVCESKDPPLAGKVLVMGLGGVFIAVQERFPAGTVLNLRLTHDRETVEAVCAVRGQFPDGIGVEFVQLRGKDEETLKRMLERFAS